jgi:hypothetical protein
MITVDGGALAGQSILGLPLLPVISWFSTAPPATVTA